MSQPTLDERFVDLRRSVDEEIARNRRELLEAVSGAVSRMRNSTLESEWSSAVIESGRPFAEEPAAVGLLGTLAALTAPGGTARSANGISEAGARRFARVKVAEILLYQASAVKAGREARDLYSVLQPQIDAAREALRERFLTAGQRAADCLHTELVRTLAHGDATLLGPGYPGPLA